MHTFVSSRLDFRTGNPCAGHNEKSKVPLERSVILRLRWWRRAIASLEQAYAIREDRKEDPSLRLSRTVTSINPVRHRAHTSSVMMIPDPPDRESLNLSKLDSKIAIR